MASYPQLASLATYMYMYEFDSAIFRLNLGNSLQYNVVFISEHGVSEFRFLKLFIYLFFIFFLRVSLKSFLKLRATRVFYTGEIIDHHILLSKLQFYGIRRVHYL